VLAHPTPAPARCGFAGWDSGNPGGPSEVIPTAGVGEA
jgi:hypothetical protein